MNQIPKVTVTPNDGGWLAVCGTAGCGFQFWHFRRDVADEQAITHQRTELQKKTGGRR